MEFTLSDIFILLYKKITLILVMVILFTFLVFSYNFFFSTDLYTSSIKAYIQPASGAETSKVSDITYVKTIVETYIEILKTYGFYEMVSDSLNNDYTAKQIKSITSFSYKKEMEIFSISVTTPSPEESKRIADAISDNAPSYITEITGNENLVIAEQAFPGTPAGSGIFVNVFIGAFFGFLVSFFIIFVQEIFKIKVDSVTDITKVYNFPIFGIVSDYNKRK